MKKALNGLVFIAVVGAWGYYNFVFNSPGEAMEFGECTLYYKGSVTADEAGALMKFLKDNEYFTKDRRSDVQLRKEKDTYQVRFVLKDDAIGDKEIEDAFNILLFSLQLGPFAGKDVEIHLCDDQLKTKQVVRAPSEAQKEEEKEKQGEAPEAENPEAPAAQDTPAAQD